MYLIAEGSRACSWSDRKRKRWPINAFHNIVNGTAPETAASATLYRVIYILTIYLAYTAGDTENRPSRLKCVAIHYLVNNVQGSVEMRSKCGVIFNDRLTLLHVYC